MVLTRTAAVLTLLGVLLNRLNVSVIAFKWYASPHYYPSWMEVEVTLAIIFAEIWAFRWIVNRMPVLRESHALRGAEKAPMDTAISEA